MKDEKGFFTISRKLKESCGYSKHNIEMAIGNYLIEQNVPIIDFYSHYIG